MNGTPASLVNANTLANPDIKWETTTMLDVGVDVTLLLETQHHGRLVPARTRRHPDEHSTFRPAWV